MEPKPYTLVNMRVWWKTKRLLKRLVELNGGSLVHNLHEAVQAAVYRAEQEKNENAIKLLHRAE